MPSAMRSCSSSTIQSDKHADGIQNYDTHEVIGSGSRCIVYRATCNRGRLRGREVALKKLPRDETQDPTPLGSSTALHQALHHPCVVSLLSGFSSPSGLYHVMELCSGDTLASLLGSRSPSVLSETELRDIVRQLVDTLSYLRSERVIHRDIKASNILLADGFRVKLSGFGLAIQLPSVRARTATFCGSPNYVAPEIISRSSYSFAVDLWSLGCLMLTCLTGVAAFEASSLPEVFDNIKHGRYSLPAGISPEAADLVSALLQVDPAKRITCENIPQHPFLLSTSSVRAPLDTTQTLAVPLILPLRNESLRANVEGKRYPDTLTLGMPSQRRPPTSVSASTNGKKAMAPPSCNFRRLLSDEFPRPSTRPLLVSSKRSFSAPQSAVTLSSAFYGVGATGPSFDLTTPALISDNASMTSSDTADNATGGGGEPHGKPFLDGSAPNEKRSQDVPPHGTKLSMTAAIKDASAAEQLELKPPKITAARTQEASTKPLIQHSLPSRAMQGRRTLLSTKHLAPQTLKVAQGQLVVLPSRSLLVDLREGERRKGKEGKEVLQISSDGTEIKVFCAPHLSTPCCLVEPLATYALVELPVKYLSLYEEASCLVTQLKQRTPRLMYHMNGVRCTLMANEPFGDIELLFPSGDKTDRQNFRMRLRLRRSIGYLEISRSVAGATDNRAEERTRKSFVTTAGVYTLANQDRSSLDAMDQAGLDHLAAFLPICSAVEAIPFGGPSLTSDIGCNKHRQPTASTGQQVHGTTSTNLEDTTSIPETYSSGMPPTSSTFLTKLPRRCLSALKHDDRTSQAVSSELVSIPFHDTMESTGGMATASRLDCKFIRAVGWCVRTRSENAVVYRIMFHDGAELEFDQGSDMVRFWSDSRLIHRFTYEEALLEEVVASRLTAVYSFVELFVAA